MISEIMFRPPGLPENPLEEFIEIHNPDAAPINLGGYSFDRGVSFTIPPGTIVPVDGYLVVASDLGTFTAAHPGVTGVVGGWSGNLSNSAEEIRLVDPGGTLVDSVRYATEGNWAQRVRDADGGWDWLSPADGDGPSLELLNPLLPNEDGQNWLPSALAGGTPGVVNSQASSDIAPLIRNVEHSPAVPWSGETVTVRCELLDEGFGPTTATLFWRVSDLAPPTFSAVEMSAEGSGTRVASIPTQPDKTIIEFYVSANDGTHSRTFPAATIEGQNANALLQFDDEIPPAGQAIHRLIMTAAENEAFQNSSTGSDRIYNVSLVSDLGSGDTIRYSSGMRTRGASSRNHNPRPMRMGVPNDNGLEGMTLFNLNPKYTYLQVLGSKIFQAAGIRTADAQAVQVRRNGVDYARHDTEFDFGRWAMVEHLDGDFIDNHWTDNGGNLYKKVRPDNGWAYRAGDVGDYQSDGFSKENNKSANDWSDLDGFFEAMNAPADDPDYLADIEAVANTGQWMRWFAAETLVANGETNVSNGADDDYSFYYPEMTAGIELVPHDFDTILRYGDGSRITDPEHTLFDMIERGDDIAPLIPFFALPSVRARYFTELRDLASTVFAPENFDPIIDNTLTGWVNAERIDGIKAFNAARRTFVLDQTVPEVGPYVPVPPTSTGTLTSAPASSIVINELLADNRGAVAIDGAFPDIIELHNRGGSPIDLSGASITDDPAAPTRFVFPTGTSVAPNDYLILAGGDPPAGGGSVTYVGFGLDSDGDQLSLFAAPADGQSLLDTVTFGIQAADLPIGRTGPGATTWTLVLPSPGAPNSAAPLGSLSAVRINEWLANPDFRYDDDFIELHNPGSAAVALGATVLTDDAINFPTRSPLPPLSFIGPGGFSAISTDDLPFGLASSGDRIALLGENGTVIDQVGFDISLRDLSEGRFPDGSATIARSSLSSPGLPNGATPQSIIDLIDGLRITEINYNPSGGNDDEFIELRNIGDVPLNLGGVRFTDGISFEFDPGTTLAPGAFIVLVEDFGGFQSAHGAGITIGGVYDGKLSNGGETLSLTLPRPFGAHILRFLYDDGWEPTTDGGGATLVIRDVEGTHPRDWNLSSSWIASAAASGSPGTGSPPIITSAAAANGGVGTPFLFDVGATFGPNTFSSGALPPGLSLEAASGRISGTPSAPGIFVTPVTATNAFGDATSDLTFTIAPQPVPVITSNGSANGLVGAFFVYQIAATNNPTSFTASGLPAWLAIDENSGRLTGIALAQSTFDVTVGATNTGGTGTATVTISILVDEIAGATDTSSLVFTQGGDADWFSQTANTHDGIDAAQSGDITHNEESTISALVTGPGEIKFWWSVSSEGNFDFLEFQLDGTAPPEVQRISGTVDWTEITYAVPAGQHTLTWTYYKDRSVNRGTDAGWVDEIRYDSPDADFDGLPDAWEELYFSRLDHLPGDDADGDGQTNLAEFLAGFDPTDPSSVFAVAAIEADGGATVSLTWNSAMGHSYQPQVSGDMKIWQDVGVPVLAEGDTVSINVPADSPGGTGVVELVTESSSARALIPISDIGTLWQGGDEAAFAVSGGDATWLSGTGGIGFESSPGSSTSYVPFIGIDVIAARDVRSSVYGRYRFDLPVDPASVQSLDFRLRVDDGFVAFINGVRIADFNAPQDLVWDSTADDDTNDGIALQLEPYPVNTPIDYLVPGENILAIQLMNGDSGSSDLLAQPTLSATVTIAPETADVFWRVIAVE